MADVAFGSEFGFFKVAENFLGAFQNRFRDASQARHLNAVALISPPLHNFAKEDDLVVPFAHGDVEIFQTRQAAGQFCQLVVMGREKRLCADLIVKMLDNTPGEAEAVEGAGAPADFIEDD